MSKESENKIEDAQFKVGDVVRLKSAKHLITLKSSSGVVYNASTFATPYMVVSEIFVDEKVGKTLFSTKENTTKPKQIKDVGEHPIRVKCTWFYEGKSYEKVFWQDVLEKV